MNKLDIYLESVYVQEDLKSLFPKINDTIGKKLVKVIDINNPEKTAKNVKRYIPRIEPKTGFAKLDKHMDSKFDKFKQYKQLANRILINSVPGLSAFMANAAATSIVIASMVAKKSEKNQSYEKNLKKNLKEVVNRARKFGEDFDDDYDNNENDESKKSRKVQDIADLSVAWAVIAVVSIGLAGVFAGGYGVLVAIGALLTTINSYLVSFLMGIILILMLSLWLKAQVGSA